MEILVKGANFSALGLGNVRWVENYITAAGITNATQKAALRTLYTAFNTAGIDQKLEVFRLFFTGSATNDALNLLDVTKYALSFQNDDPTVHTSTGYQGSVSPYRYGISTYMVRDLNNFHMHQWHNTAETNSSAYGLGRLQISSGGNNFTAYIRRGPTTIGGVINSNSPSGTVLTASDATGMGLASVARVATVTNLYNAGAKVGTNTTTYVGTTDGTAPVLEGNAFPATSTYSNAGKILSFAYGQSLWTDADELALFNAITAFKVSLGI
jgi:hypothetical protein